MKNFLKIFFVIIFSFVSLSAFAVDSVFLNADNISPVVQVIYPADNETENSISSSNYYNAEILNLKEQKPLYISSALSKASPQSKFLAYILAQNLNCDLLKSNKISNLLKTEICTRAP